jgi:hypothetical protein
MEPVLSSFAQTKSDAPQLEQTGATKSPSALVRRLLWKKACVLAGPPGGRSFGCVMKK